MSEPKAFRVDLRGLVDLLSRHLYSSPRVFVRELVQNSVDAVAARRLAEPDAPGRVLLVPSDVAPDGRLHCLDTGVGLTAEEVDAFLATIGASSKRDELGLAREAFLGQFGIGLLSCFLVGDEIDVLTSTGRGVAPTRWVGRSDGLCTTEDVDPAALVAHRGLLADVLAAAGVTDWPQGPGTWVRLAPRRGATDRTSAAEVERLAVRFARMLPVDVSVARPSAGEAGAETGGPRRVSRRRRPWDVADDVLADRREESEHLLGVPLLAAVPVQVREAQLSGVLGILAVPTAPTSRQSHQVYAKGMLVGEAVEGLLPEWAFFARALVDAGSLRLTASREALYDDDLLAVVRESLGEQLRRWLLRTAHVDPDRFAELLRLHELGIRALAVHDDDLYRVYVPTMSLESSVGTTTVQELRRRFDVVRWTASVDEFRQVLPVASAHDVGVVNAGYSYLDALMERLDLLDPPVRQLRVHPGDLDAHIDGPPPDVLAEFAGFLQVAGETLAPLQVQVGLRTFRPASLPALVLDDREREHRRASREVASESDDVWAGILEALDDGEPAQIRLLLNADNPVVRRIRDLDDEHVQSVAVETLWCQALLLGQRPLRPVDRTVLNRSFVELLDLALDGLGGRSEDEA